MNSTALLARVARRFSRRPEFLGYWLDLYRDVEGMELPALTRDKFWSKACATCDAEREKDPKRKGGAVMIARARMEQGFAVRTHGDPSRELIDMEGVTLVRIPGARLQAGPGTVLDPSD